VLYIMRNYTQMRFSDSNNMQSLNRNRQIVINNRINELNNLINRVANKDKQLTLFNKVSVLKNKKLILERRAQTLKRSRVTPPPRRTQVINKQNNSHLDRKRMHRIQRINNMSMQQQRYRNRQPLQNVYTNYMNKPVYRHPRVRTSLVTHIKPALRHVRPNRGYTKTAFLTSIGQSLTPHRRPAVFSKRSKCNYCLYKN